MENVYVSSDNQNANDFQVKTALQQTDSKLTTLIRCWSVIMDVVRDTVT